MIYYIYVKQKNVGNSFKLMHNKFDLSKINIQNKFEGIQSNCFRQIK